MSDLHIEKIVYFVRHGQSEANVAPVFQSSNSPLNEKGKEQAESVASRVAKLQFETLIASPFQRAKETAEAIEKATGKKPEFSDLFIERVKPKSINSRSYDDMEANNIWREWEKSLYTADMRVEDGENFNDLVERADKALTFLTNRPEQSIVVVTHGYFLRTIVARVLIGKLLSGEVFEAFQKSTATENTGITVLRYQTGFERDLHWRLWIYNDHAHLG